jgi:hypothetical protein
MTYKTNTPNYKTKNVSNFSDFMDNIESEKENLKDIKRGFNLNHDDTQKYTKNSKLNFNKVTRKMDDITLDDVNDKLENLEESATEVNISSMKRFLDDYSSSHNPFQKRGMDEGVEILRNSKDIESAILNINKKVEEWTSKEKADLMPEDQRMDIISGLEDLVKNLESKLVSESHIDDDMFIKITNKPSYKKLISDMRKAVDDYIGTLEDTGFDEGDNDHHMALSTAISEACNIAMDL